MVRNVSDVGDHIAHLTREQYRVTQQHGTEPPFSGEYNGFKGNGTFACVCCGQSLFSSQTKYDSGSGWPSFYQPIDEQAVGVQADSSMGMRREEVHCSQCQAHLGHVFPDGPDPTGLRFCINSLSLDFKPE